jgi:hypothetical protein
MAWTCDAARGMQVIVLVSVVILLSVVGLYLSSTASYSEHNWHQLALFVRGLAQEQAATRTELLTALGRVEDRVHGTSHDSVPKPPEKAIDSRLQLPETHGPLSRQPHPDRHDGTTTKKPAPDLKEQQGDGTPAAKATSEQAELKLRHLESSVRGLSQDQAETRRELLDALGKVEDRLVRLQPSRHGDGTPAAKASSGLKPPRIPRGGRSRGWQFPVDLDVSRDSKPPMTESVPHGLTWGDPVDECEWRFSRYEPSQAEASWRSEVLAIDPINICGPFRTQFKSARDAYVAELPKCIPHNASDVVPPASCDQNPPRKFHDVFSLMKYKRTCNGSTEEQSVAIEPLMGMLRHPQACDWNQFDTYVFDKNYMVVEPWRAHNNRQLHTKAGRPPRNFFFDLGASTYNAGLGGASQSWFMSVFENVCVAWDGVWAWEAKKHDPTKVWEEIPGYLHGRYRYYNVPCSNETDSWANPWNTLLSVATPEDYVVVKLDIDTWQVENPLVDQILSTPALLERIDEFFYEHHVLMEKIRRHWGRSMDKRLTSADSVDMFTRLRSAGIHVHSWV